MQTDADGIFRAGILRLPADELQFCRIWGGRTYLTLPRSSITGREGLKRAGAASALALGPSVLAQNQNQQPKVKPGQEPKPESQAAQQYPHPPGVFINRPLTQITTAAETLLDDLEGRG